MSLQMHMVASHRAARMCEACAGNEEAGRLRVVERGKHMAGYEQSGIVDRLFFGQIGDEVTKSDAGFNTPGCQFKYCSNRFQRKDAFFVPADEAHPPFTGFILEL